MSVNKNLMKNLPLLMEKCKITEEDVTKFMSIYNCNKHSVNQPTDQSNNQPSTDQSNQPTDQPTEPLNNNMMMKPHVTPQHNHNRLQNCIAECCNLSEEQIANFMKIVGSKSDKSINKNIKTRGTNEPKEANMHSVLTAIAQTCNLTPEQIAKFKLLANIN